MLEHLYGKRFGLKIAWANRKEGWQRSGGSVYRNRLCRVTTHMEVTATSLRKGDSHIKHNSLTSTIPWLTPTRALSPSHTRPWPPCGSLPSTTRFFTRNHPYPVTLPSYCLRLFSSQTFSRINTPTFSNLVILHTYQPTKMEQTMFRNVGI
jgi:hypothetical protein